MPPCVYILNYRNDLFRWDRLAPEFQHLPFPTVHNPRGTSKLIISWEQHYAAISGNFLPNFRDNLSVPASAFKNPIFILDSWTLKKGPIGCPETSVRNYHYLLRNNPGWHCSQLLRGGSLKSLTIPSPIILAFHFPSISTLFKKVSWIVVRSEVLAAVLLKIPVFWDMTPCRWSSSSWRLEKLFFIAVQGQAVVHSCAQELLDCLILKTNSPASFQTSRTTPPTTERQMPKDLTLLPNGHTASVFGRFLTLAYTGDPSVDHALPSVWSYCTRSYTEITPVFNGTSRGVH